MNKYKVTVKGKRWKGIENGNIQSYDTIEEGIIIIEHTHDDDYGNQKYMYVDEGFNYLLNIDNERDIRYDTDYDPDNEEEYIKNYGKNWYAESPKFWYQIDKITVDKITE